jgi:hypothetical protein
MSHPITSRCFPSDAEAGFTIETSLDHDVLVERVPVNSLMNEVLAFELEVARLRTIRAATREPWDPVVVRLLCRDREIRKELVA